MPSPRRAQHLASETTQQLRTIRNSAMTTDGASPMPGLTSLAYPRSLDGATKPSIMAFITEDQSSTKSNTRGNQIAILVRNLFITTTKKQYPPHLATTEQLVLDENNVGTTLTVPITATQRHLVVNGSPVNRVRPVAHGCGTTPGLATVLTRHTRITRRVDSEGNGKRVSPPPHVTQSKPSPGFGSNSDAAFQRLPQR